MLGNYPGRLGNAQIQGQARRCPLNRSLPISITFPGYQLPPRQVPKATPWTWLAGNRGTEAAHSPQTIQQFHTNQYDSKNASTRERTLNKVLKQVN